MGQLSLHCQVSIVYWGLPLYKGSSGDIAEDPEKGEDNLSSHSSQKPHIHSSVYGSCQDLHLSIHSQNRETYQSHEHLCPRLPIQVSSRLLGYDPTVT